MGKMPLKQNTPAGKEVYRPVFVWGLLQSGSD